MRLDSDDFELFDLPRRYTLSREALDARWKALQSQVHPDRFASEGAAAQRVAMQWAVRVNEAYRRLREPLARAAYLCELLGQPVDAENNTAMPPEFLMQQMEWREALDDVRDAPATEALAEQVAAASQARFETVARLLDGSPPDAAAAAREVRALMFIDRFRQDLDERLDSLQA